MSDTRLTVGELKKELEKFPDEAVLFFYSSRYWPFYRVYLFEDPIRKADIIDQLNTLLGEKLGPDTSLVIMK